MQGFSFEDALNRADTRAQIAEARVKELEKRLDAREKNGERRMAQLEADLSTSISQRAMVSDERDRLHVQLNDALRRVKQLDVVAVDHEENTEERPLFTAEVAGAMVDRATAEMQALLDARDARVKELEAEAERDLVSGIPDDVVGVLSAVQAEVQQARANWPAFNSAHEGFGVLAEEVDELWDHVKTNQKRRDLEKMRKEAIQVAAMGVRFALEVCGEERGRK